MERSQARIEGIKKRRDGGERKIVVRPGRALVCLRPCERQKIVHRAFCRQADLLKCLEAGGLLRDIRLKNMLFDEEPFELTRWIFARLRIRLGIRTILKETVSVVEPLGTERDEVVLVSA